MPGEHVGVKLVLCPSLFHLRWRCGKTVNTKIMFSPCFTPPPMIWGRHRRREGRGVVRRVDRWRRAGSVSPSSGQGTGTSTGSGSRRPGQHCVQMKSECGIDIKTITVKETRMGGDTKLGGVREGKGEQRFFLCEAHF